MSANKTEIQPTTPPNRWQFRLWHLFAVTTYVAVVIAVARKWGIETLPVTIGVSISWLNYNGVFSFLQRGKLQLATLFMAWGLFWAPSFCQRIPDGSPQVGSRRGGS
jgi:hypothetical protein